MTDKRLKYMRREIKMCIIETLNKRSFFKKRSGYKNYRVCSETNDIADTQDKLRNLEYLCRRVDYHDSFKPYAALFKAKMIEIMLKGPNKVL